MIDYRITLKKLLDDRQAKNPRFSMRAFAAKVEMSHSALSQVFKGTRNLSPEASIRIARALRLTGAERQAFLLQVRWVHANGEEERQEIEREMASVQQFATPLTIEGESAQALLDWVGYALFAMKTFPWASLKTKDLSKILDMPEKEVEAALERLEKTGLLARDGQGRPVLRERRVLTFENQAELLRLHQAMVRMSMRALMEEKSPHMIAWSETFPMSTRYMAEAEEMTADYVRRMSALREKARQEGNPPDELYQLLVMFHNMLPGRWQK